MADFLPSLPQLLDYNSCVLLLSLDAGQLLHAGTIVADTYGWPLVSVARELSDTLLGEPCGARPRAARLWLEDRLDHVASDTAVCTGIDLLFEPSWDLDPLALFRRIARRTRLVVTWPGSYTASVLAYAVPEHAHYRTWRNLDVAVCQLQPELR